ncbi:MAG TPA: PspC domain-containing protein [Candidatus Paceibacterota bacterium]
MKKLYRSRNNNVISGVLGGVAEYFGVDPMIVRLIFLFVVFLTGVFPALIVYFIAILAVPFEDRSKTS